MCYKAEHYVLAKINFKKVSMDCIVWFWLDQFDEFTVENVYIFSKMLERLYLRENFKNTCLLKIVDFC